MKNFLTLFISVISAVSFAQLQNIPLITVTGESVVKVSPDYVILDVRIKKQLLTNASNNPSFEIFKEEDTKIRLFDFNEADLSKTVIQTDSSSIYYKEVFITVYDLKKLDKYLLELYNLGYRDYVYMDYRVSNYNRYKTQARKEAINAAKKKAQLLATELGQIIGKAHSIDDVYSEDYNWYNLKDKVNLEKLTFKAGADTYLIEPGYITITAKVKVSFDLP